jgi:hypothetical protein
MGDAVATGHGCTPVTICDEPILNWNVKCEGRLLTQQLDTTIPHTIGVPPVCPMHVGIIHKGWPNVFCWFFPQAYLGSQTDMGAITSGAVTVWVGGKPASGAQAPADGSRNSLGQQTGGGASQGWAGG